MAYYGILAFFVLEYVRPGNYLPILTLLHLNSLVPIAVILATLFSETKYSHVEVLKESNSKLLLLMLGLILTSFTIAEVTTYAFNTFTTVFGYCLVYFVIAKQITDLRRLKGLFTVLIFVHLTLAALTPQMLLDPSTRHYIASGTFLGDGNDYALSVTITIPMCLFLLMNAPTLWKKVLGAMSLLVLVLCVVGTQSRGGTLALGFVGLHYWWKSEKKMVTGAMAVAALAAVMVFAPPAYFTRMNTISTYETDGSAQARILAWRAGTAMMLSNPLLGVGAGQFPPSYTRFAPGSETGWKTAHSIYFLLLGELGVPGLGVLLFFVFSNLYLNRRLSEQIRNAPTLHTSEHLQLLACLSVSVIAFAVAGAFLSAAYYPHMFVLCGLLVSARRLVREGLRGVPAAELVAKAKPAPSRLSLLAGPALGRQAISKSLVPGNGQPRPHGRFF